MPRPVPCGIRPERAHSPLPRIVRLAIFSRSTSATTARAERMKRPTAMSSNDSMTKARRVSGLHRIIEEADLVLVARQPIDLVSQHHIGSALTREFPQHVH